MPATTLFISDLHLCGTRPAITGLFLDFLRHRARSADALYILGDLFEYWIGDEAVEQPEFRPMVQGLHELTAAGTPVFVMHGNRDFLLGPRFADAAGVRLVKDPVLVDCNGVATLLTHGDALCTDDVDYMRFRAEVRSEQWIETFLATPLPERKTKIEALRRESEAEKKRKPNEIMDVSANAVHALLRQHGYPRLIHGHTHRPAIHEHLVDGHRCERWVLADWYASGSYLRCAGREITAVTLPR